MSFMTLTNQELNKKAKEIVIEKFKEFGCQSIEKERNLYVKTKEGKALKS
ncbi:hypothetical protein ACFSCX_02400 [Bacillus salitolerans]|uniref:Fur-regulated basic protein FbpA n=1 Tax=Bacillus salitolerans TaxID=1437434 RepID=A0ABW4LJM9_9BACI